MEEKVIEEKWRRNERKIEVGGTKVEERGDKRRQQQVETTEKCVIKKEIKNVE